MTPKILLVDDEERFRITLGKMLRAQGLEVTVLGSGREALEELNKEAYDVMVLDVRMPDMDGIATLTEIKKIAPQIEVIILTGHASMDAAVEIMTLGGYDYLLKPCPVEDLLAKIESAYERKITREGKVEGKG
jgi:DNA-binding NtrC family response regulator